MPFPLLKQQQASRCCVVLILPPCYKIFLAAKRHRPIGIDVLRTGERCPASACPTEHNFAFLGETSWNSANSVRTALLALSLSAPTHEIGRVTMPTGVSAGTPGSPDFPASPPPGLDIRKPARNVPPHQGEPMQGRILQPRGRLDIATYTAFERDVLVAVEAGSPWLVFDFSDVLHVTVLACGGDDGGEAPARRRRTCRRLWHANANCRCDRGQRPESRSWRSPDRASALAALP